MKIASVAEVKAQLSELERLVMARSPRLQSILEASRQQIRRGRGISHEDFWREMEAETSVKRRPQGSKGKV